MERAIATSLLLGAVAAVSLAQPLVIKTTTILDGKGGVLRNKEIVIEGSKISRVADARGNATYDLSDLTVMPGWIDTHTHPGWYFNRENRVEQGGRRSIETPAASALYAESNAYATLIGGFTTIQSLGRKWIRMFAISSIEACCQALGSLRPYGP
jgi:imidazolonepropionase-like amidohydrolase